MGSVRSYEILPSSVSVFSQTHGEWLLGDIVEPVYPHLLTVQFRAKGKICRKHVGSATSDIRPVGWAEARESGSGAKEGLSSSSYDIECDPGACTRTQTFTWTWKGGPFPDEHNLGEGMDLAWQVLAGVHMFQSVAAVVSLPVCGDMLECDIAVDNSSSRGNASFALLGQVGRGDVVQNEQQSGSIRFELRAHHPRRKSSLDTGKLRLSRFCYQAGTSWTHGDFCSQAGTAFVQSITYGFALHISLYVQREQLSRELSGELSGEGPASAVSAFFNGNAKYEHLKDVRVTKFSVKQKGGNPAKGNFRAWGSDTSLTSLSNFRDLMAKFQGFYSGDESSDCVLAPISFDVASPWKYLDYLWPEVSLDKAKVFNFEQSCEQIISIWSYLSSLSARLETAKSELERFLPDNDRLELEKAIEQNMPLLRNALSRCRQFSDEGARHMADKEPPHMPVSFYALLEGLCGQRRLRAADFLSRVQRCELAQCGGNWYDSALEFRGYVLGEKPILCGTLHYAHDGSVFGGSEQMKIPQLHRLLSDNIWARSSAVLRELTSGW